MFEWLGLYIGSILFLVGFFFFIKGLRMANQATERERGSVVPSAAVLRGDFTVGRVRVGGTYRLRNEDPFRKVVAQVTSIERNYAGNYWVQYFFLHTTPDVLHTLELDDFVRMYDALEYDANEKVS